MAALGSLAILLVISTFSNCKESRPLGDYIRHYEALNYDPSTVHRIHRRALSENTHYELQFFAFNRLHKLRLRRDNGIFTEDAVVKAGDGSPIELDRGAIVEGEVVGESGSQVHGIMEDGMFRGKIIGTQESFYVEPATRYLRNPKFHSVIYRSNDVENWGSYGDISSRLPSIPDRKRRDTKSGQHSERQRSRRATESQKRKNSCTLGIYADHLFTKLFGGKNQAVYKIVEHVKAVQIIYSNAFNSTELYQPYSITFRVKSITIYDSSTVPSKYNRGNLGIDPMLDLFSDEDHSSVCEAFMFTDRDFDGGILGLAWIGNPKTLGGICSPYATIGGGKGKSYNTGIVTLKLYKRFTPPKVSEVTFAHELGHGFGSQHDPTGDCSPGGVAGNYIMFSKATPGDRTNNNLFSDCSLKAIRDDINAKRSSSSYSSCFVSAGTPICGNRIVEAPEQCDCGDKNTCKQQGNCCNPPGQANECRLSSSLGVLCSPSQGHCCNNQCKYAGTTVLCRNKTECLKEAKCSGTSFTCVKSVHRPPGTVCEGGRRVCSAGSCSMSICTKYSLVECQCSAEKELCDICCKEKGQGKSCVSAHSLNQLPAKLQDLKKVPGTPCDNMHGYCDAFSVCRRVDMNGPLKRLKEKFFTVKGLKQTVKEYWWVILLGIIGGIIVVALMIILCSRYTPSSNPIKEQKKPAKKIPGRKRKNVQQLHEGRHSPTFEAEQQV